MPTLRGVITGTTIELERPAGLPDGQAVAVTLVPLPADEALPPGEGLRRAFGSWAGDDETGLDEFLAWSRSQRKIDRRGVDEWAS